MLPNSFFQVDPLLCASNLVGTELVWEKCSGVVVETEAYLVEGDEACHAFSRPSTRAFVGRNKAGAAYIYFNYGVHWMLNVLVKGGPRDGLILIRAIEPRRGLALMRKRRGVEDVKRLCSGPGKLTQALAITKRHHEIDLCSDPVHCFRARPDDDIQVVADPRIGISRAKEFPWRFTVRASPFVSVPVRAQNCSEEEGRAPSSERRLWLTLAGTSRAEPIMRQRQELAALTSLSIAPTLGAR